MLDEQFFLNNNFSKNFISLQFQFFYFWKFKNLDNFGRKSNSSSIYNLNNEEHKSHRVQKIKHEKIVELKKARSTKINSIATKISDLDSKTPSNLFNANKISTKDSLKTSVEKYDEALTKIILNSNAIKDMYPKKTELLNSMKTSFKFSDFKANLTKISMMFKLTKVFLLIWNK